MKTNLIRVFSSMYPYFITITLAYPLLFLIYRPYELPYISFSAPVLQWFICFLFARKAGRKAAHVKHNETVDKMEYLQSACRSLLLLSAISLAFFMSGLPHLWLSHIYSASRFAACYLGDIWLDWRALLTYWFYYVIYVVSLYRNAQWIGQQDGASVP